MEDYQSLGAKGNTRLWIVSILTCLQSFLFGYGMSSLNSAFKEKTSDAPGSMLWDIDLDTTEQEIATSMTIVGAAIGCFAAAPFVNRYGQRPVLIANNAFFLLGAALTGFTSEALLMIGRFILGLGVGVSSSVVPVLVAELSPAEERGKFTTLHQLLLTIGILTASIMNFIFIGSVSHGWKYVQFFTLIPSIIQVIFNSMIPESPRVLIRKGLKDETRKVIAMLREAPTPAYLDEQINQMEEELRQSSGGNVTWREVFAGGQPIYIGLGIMFFQPLSGINAVILYSTKIFGFAGVSNDILATLSVTALNVVMTIVSVVLVDRAGRKTLLTFGTALMLAALFVLGVSLLALNSNVSLQGIIAVLGVLVYIAGFAIGLGAVSWVILGELVPTHIRSSAFSLFIAENWFWNLLISLFTLSSIEGLGGGQSDDQKKKGVAILFLIFGGITMAAFLFILSKVPETKGRSTEDIQALLNATPTQSSSTLGHSQVLTASNSVSTGNDTNKLLATNSAV